MAIPSLLPAVHMRAFAEAGYPVEHMPVVSQHDAFNGSIPKGIMKIDEERLHGVVFKLKVVSSRKTTGCCCFLKRSPDERVALLFFETKPGVAWDRPDEEGGAGWKVYVAGAYEVTRNITRAALSLGLPGPFMGRLPEAMTPDCVTGLCNGLYKYRDEDGVSYEIRIDNDKAPILVPMRVGSCKPLKQQ